MEAAKDTFFGGGLIVLDEFHIDAGFFEVVVVVGFHEITPLIAEYGWGYDFEACDGAGFYGYL